MDGRWMAFSPIAIRVRCLSLVAHDKKGQLFNNRDTCGTASILDFAPSCFRFRYIDARSMGGGLHSV